MAVTNLQESIWRRGWNDTKRGWLNWRFFVLEAVMAPTIGFVIGFTIKPNVGFIVGMGIVVVGLIGVWIGATASAPVRQRNEALKQLCQAHGDDVASAIAALGQNVLTRHGGSTTLLQLFSSSLDDLALGVTTWEMPNMVNEFLTGTRFTTQLSSATDARDLERGPRLDDILAELDFNNAPEIRAIVVKMCILDLIEEYIWPGTPDSLGDYNKIESLPVNTYKLTKLGQEVGKRLRGDMYK